MSIAAQAKNCVETYLDIYRQRQGESTDPYHPEPLYHPMAEGKYLLTLAALKRAGCLGDIRHEEWLTAAKSRLQAHAIPTGEQGIGFGLNFGYKDAAADEPYLITTSIVLRGLLENLALLDHTKNIFGSLPQNCLNWMHNLPKLKIKHTTLHHVPVFSPHNPKIVFNAVAYWAGTLHLASDMGFSCQDASWREVPRWMWETFVPGHGWPYEPESTRFDLLHQCYILNSLRALRSATDLEWMAVQTLSWFAIPGGLMDKYDLQSPEEAVSLATKSGSVCAHFGPNQAVIMHDEPARMWSWGEMLAVMATMAAQGKLSEYWHASMKRSTRWTTDTWHDGTIEESLSTFGFRHLMHLAHGLACVLEVLRSPGFENPGQPSPVIQ